MYETQLKKKGHLTASSVNPLRGKVLIYTARTDFTSLVIDAMKLFVVLVVALIKLIKNQLHLPKASFW